MSAQSDAAAERSAISPLAAPGEGGPIIERDGTAQLRVVVELREENERLRAEIAETSRSSGMVKIATSHVNFGAEEVQDSIAAAAHRLTGLCHAASRQSGWWDRPDAQAPLMTPVRLMLIVSELGEAMEGDRKQRQDDHLPQFTSLEVELADAAIRIFDMAGGQGLRVAEAIAAKLAYNQQRHDHKLSERAKPGGKAY